MDFASVNGDVYIIDIYQSVPANFRGPRSATSGANHIDLDVVGVPQFVF